MDNHLIIHWFELLIKQIQYDQDSKKGKERLQFSYRLKSINKFEIKPKLPITIKI